MSGSNHCPDSTNPLTRSTRASSAPVTPTPLPVDPAIETDHAGCLVECPLGGDGPTNINAIGDGDPRLPGIGPKADDDDSCGWAYEQSSWTKPGSVRSSVRQSPPNMAGLLDHIDNQTRLLRVAAARSSSPKPTTTSAERVVGTTRRPTVARRSRAFPRSCPILPDPAAAPG